MPNIKSAKKRVKTDALKKVRNKDNVASMRTAIKKAKVDVKNNSKEQADVSMKAATKKIDKALSSGLIHKNKASRLKSKLMKAVNNIK